MAEHRSLVTAASALVVAAALAGCAHAEAPYALPHPTASPVGDVPRAAEPLPPEPSPAPSPALPDGDGGVADVAVVPLITVRDAGPLDPRCPVPVENPELVVARVGRTRITACEVMLEWHRRTRAGLRADDPQTLVRGLVREVMLSTRAPMPLPQDAEIARTLADALLRQEAAAAMEPVDTTDRALARYAEAHRGQFVRDARLHVRAVALPTREAALSALAAMRAGEPLAAIAASAPDRTLRRDQGDLGMWTEDPTPAVPPAVVQAARALTRDGELCAEPVQVTRTVPGSRRARRPSRTESAWWVVERIAQSAEENLPEDQVRRRVAQRLLRERYRDALRDADVRLRASVAEPARRAVQDDALRTLRVDPWR
jgi:hypothetical protein